MKGLHARDGVVRFPTAQLAMGAILLQQEVREAATWVLWAHGCLMVARLVVLAVGLVCVQDAGRIHVGNLTHQNAEAHMR